MERDDAFFQREDATFQGVVFRVQGGVEKMTHIRRFHTSKNFFLGLYISFFCFLDNKQLKKNWRDAKLTYFTFKTLYYVYLI